MENSRESFKKLDYWKKKISGNASEDIQVYLLGNKIDLEDKRQVTYEEGQQYQLDNNLDFFIETSVEREETINDLFYHTITMLYETYINSGRKYDINIDKKVKPKKSILLMKKKKQKKKESKSNDKESGSCEC